MDAAKCWNCNAGISSGIICSECKIASDWVENYFEDGEVCNDCRYHNREEDVNSSVCTVDDPNDCPALP